ncbi:unnamed protein product [Rhodiola kirilowii]
MFYSIEMGLLGESDVQDDAWKEMHDATLGRKSKLVVAEVGTLCSSCTLLDLLSSLYYCLLRLHS